MLYKEKLEVIVFSLPVSFLRPVKAGARSREPDETHV